MESFSTISVFGLNVNTLAFSAAMVFWFFGVVTIITAIALPGMDEVHREEKKDVARLGFGFLGLGLIVLLLNNLTPYLGILASIVVVALILFKGWQLAFRED